MEHPSPRSFLAGRGRGFLVVVSKGAPAWCDHRALQTSNTRKVPNHKHRLSNGSSSGIRVSSVSLKEHILEQVRAADLMEDQRQIAQLIIGRIDEYGYLHQRYERRG